jgi:hypothetical protein
MKKPPIRNAIAGGSLMAHATAHWEITFKARAALLRQGMLNSLISKDVPSPRGAAPLASDGDG